MRGIRRKDGCECDGAAHGSTCNRPDVVLAREYVAAVAGSRGRKLVVRKILALLLVADPDGGGHEAARYVAEAGHCEDAAGAGRLLLRAVEVAVGAGAAASEMGDAGRRAAWCRVRGVGATV